jgi:elongation of very long chain fatty acids protein 4
MEQVARELAKLPLEFPDRFVNYFQTAEAHAAVYLKPLEHKLKDVMVAYIPGVVSALDNFVKRNGSVHAAKLPLMDPYRVLAILFGYLVVITFLRLITMVLPKFQMKYLSRIHDVLLIGLSGYMCIEIVRQAIIHRYSFWLNDVDPSPAGWPMAKVVWLFYVSKIYEFVDTVLMLLKQNYRQFSVLHVYHHASIFPIWWLVTFLAPGGDTYFSAALNSFIHVVMYTYYLFTSFGCTFKHKAIITKMQMGQFWLNFLQASANLAYKRAGYPYMLSQILFVYMLSLLALFFNFLVQDRKRAALERNSKKKVQ